MQMRISSKAAKLGVSVFQGLQAGRYNGHHDNQPILLGLHPLSPADQCPVRLWEWMLSKSFLITLNILSSAERNVL